MPTRLLVLDAFDLHDLMDRQPELAARIQEAARAKLGHALDEPGGDLASEELSNAPSCNLVGAERFPGPRALTCINPLQRPSD